MTDINVQNALEALRGELQADRLAVQEGIQKGFQSLADQFTSHMEQDREDFSTVGSRLTALESDQRTIKAGIGTILAGALATFFGWLGTR